MSAPDWSDEAIELLDEEIKNHTYTDFDPDDPDTGVGRPDRLREVLEFAAREEASTGRGSRFDMGNWFIGEATKDAPGAWEPPCGTAACLAGTAAAFYAPEGTTFKNALVRLPPEPGQRRGASHAMDQYGADALDLGYQAADILFYMTDEPLAVIRGMASRLSGVDMTLPGDEEATVKWYTDEGGL